MADSGPESDDAGTGDTDAEVAADAGCLDTDGDGTDDCLDECPDDSAKERPGECGCGVADSDRDGDSTPDCLDECPSDGAKAAPGMCGCGLSDADGDGDGSADCVDLCPADPQKSDAGICGCGISDVDSDGDGIPDCEDGCVADPDKVAPGTCGCGVADDDGDGDAIPDCNDDCPADPDKLEPGTCGCGLPDDDLDGDGWLACEGDCCQDSSCAGSVDPSAINPGAFDFAGNGLDDDCSGAVDNAISSCSSDALFASVSGLDLARAMDLCRETTETATGANRSWGVLSAEVLGYTDGGSFRPEQVGVLQSYGTNVSPWANGTMAALSAGTARDPGDPGFTSPDATDGHDPSSQGTLPAGLSLFSGCETSSDARDIIRLRLRIRVPTNVAGYGFNFEFFTPDFLEDRCTGFHDVFVAIDPNVPTPYGNIVFDRDGNSPVWANSFFQTCGRFDLPEGECSHGASRLAGTGMDLVSGMNVTGGSTGPLSATAPVTPGSVLELEFYLANTDDHVNDPLVLLDAFRWLQ